MTVVVTEPEAVPQRRVGVVDVAEDQSRWKVSGSPASWPSCRGVRTWCGMVRYVHTEGRGRTRRKEGREQGRVEEGHEGVSPYLSAPHEGEEAH